MMNGSEILIELVQEAQKALCTKAKCGSIIISKDGAVVGRGYNSPPQDTIAIARCSIKKDTYHTKVVDKTCCVHAEQRAILDATRNNPNSLAGSTLYYIRLDEKGAPKPSGAPHCTLCSKLALDVGISYFALYHYLEAPTLYPTNKYNTLSFNYKGTL